MQSPAAVLVTVNRSTGSPPLLTRAFQVACSKAAQTMSINTVGVIGFCLPRPVVVRYAPLRSVDSQTPLSQAIYTMDCFYCSYRSLSLELIKSTSSEDFIGYGY